MAKDKKKTASRILMIAGIAMILCAALALGISNVIKSRAADKAQDIVSRIESVIPEKRQGAPDGRADVNMPVLSIDGVDFAAIIEVPAYSAKLPVYGRWDALKVSAYPCRYTGSMYDGSLVIGMGESAVMQSISVGDAVYITDMTGLCYAYGVSDMIVTDDVSTEHLTSLDADLVLFARRSYSGEYTVVCCKN